MTPKEQILMKFQSQKKIKFQENACKLSSANIIQLVQTSMCHHIYPSNLTAKIQKTQVTLTFDLLTWKWYLTHCYPMGCICITYEYNPWNRQWATEQTEHAGQTDRGRETNFVVQRYKNKENMHIYTVEPLWYASNVSLKLQNLVYFHAPFFINQAYFTPHDSK